MKFSSERDDQSFNVEGETVEGGELRKGEEIGRLLKTHFKGVGVHACI